MYDLEDAVEAGAVGRCDISYALGGACTTVARAIEHLTAALQLPYRATRGWLDCLGAAEGRAGSVDQWLVIYDAVELLRHEDQDRWLELAAALGSEPRHMGGGSSTLVLLDDPLRWEQSRFGSAKEAQAAARQGRQSQ